MNEKNQEQNLICETEELQKNQIETEDNSEQNLESEQQQNEIDIQKIIEFISKIESRTKRVLKKKYNYMKFRSICSKFEELKENIVKYDVVNDKNIILNKLVLLNTYLHIISCADDQNYLKTTSYIELVNKMINDAFILNDNIELDSSVLLNNILVFIKDKYNITLNIDAYLQKVVDYQRKSQEISKKNMEKKLSKMKKIISKKSGISLSKLEKILAEANNKQDIENVNKVIENSETEKNYGDTK